MIPAMAAILPGVAVIPKRYASVVAVAAIAFAAPAAAQVPEAADALRTDPVYVDPQAEQASAVDAAALRSEIGDKPIYIAVLPESAVQGSPGRTLIALREDVGEDGRYALVVGDEVRTLPANATPSGDLQTALMEFASADPESSSGGAIAGLFVIALLIAVAAGGAVLLVKPAAGAPATGSRKRARRISTRTSCGSATELGRSRST